jgi:hypothetical protein
MTTTFDTNDVFGGHLGLDESIFLCSHGQRNKAVKFAAQIRASNDEFLMLQNLHRKPVNNLDLSI